MVSAAHRSQTGGGMQSTRGRIAAIAAVVLVVAAVAVVVVHERGGSHSPATGSTGSGGHTATATGPGQGGSTGGSTGSRGSSGTSTSTTDPIVPLRLTHMDPVSSGALATNGAISLLFSQPLSQGSPLPTLNPSVAGQWQADGDSLVFHPSAGYVPDTNVTVHVPASLEAMEHGQSVRLGKSVSTSYQVGAGSTLRLQQLLAYLGYLPLRFDGPSPAASSAAAVSTAPATGAFSWKYADVPSTLSSQWQPGSYNLITKGAVMAFEGDHGLADGWADGIAGPEVWTALLKAVATDKTDPRPYYYIMVNEVGTEYTKVWDQGKIVYTTLSNTGVPGAATQQGTFAVASHLPSTVMKGTDVNGSPYTVTVPDAAYFNGGDAIHGYFRNSYGFPQSNGCVEEPFVSAAHLFNTGMDWYGTLVTVENTTPGPTSV